MFAKLRLRLFGQMLADAWHDCETAFEHDIRAQEYDKNGDPERARWQRKQAAAIRNQWGQASS